MGFNPNGKCKLTLNTEILTCMRLTGICHGLKVREEASLIGRWFDFFCFGRIMFRVCVCVNEQHFPFSLHGSSGPEQGT